MDNLLTTQRYSVGPLGLLCKQLEKYLLECCIIYFWTVKGWVKTFAQVIYAVSLMGLIEVKQDLVLTDIFSRFYKEIILCEKNCI